MSVWLVVCANISGKDKMKFLVIGTSKQPKCFKGVKSLKVNYDLNKKTWIIFNFFTKRLVYIRKWV